MNSSLHQLLDPAALARVRLPIAAARTLPREAFIDDAVYRLERERIYSRHWIASCFTTDVPAAGDTWPFLVAGIPLVAVRGSDGRIRTFHNITPYDGCLLQMAPARRLSRLVTPYHGWEYGLDGRLLRASYWNGLAHAPLDRVSNLPVSLAEVPCREFLGAVFVNLGESPQDFAAYVAPIARSFPEYDFGLSEFLADESGSPVTVQGSCRCNWKTFFENSAINVLHEHFVHEAYRRSPQTPRVDAAGRKTFHEIMDGELFGLGFSAAAFAATYPALDIPHLGRDGRKPDAATFATLYPNFYVSILPDFIEVAMAMPNSVAETQERKQFRVHRDVARDPDFVRAAESMSAGFAQAAREDCAICEAVQQARQSPVHSQRIFSPFWDVMHHRFSNRVLDDLEVALV